MAAARMGHAGIARRLLEAGDGRHDMVASMRHPTTRRCPTPVLTAALERAVYRGDPGMTSLLPEQGAAADRKAQTDALDLAIWFRDGSMVGLLRRHGERQPS